jgi:hypothetical protein
MRRADESTESRHKEARRSAASRLRNGAA